MVALEMDRVVPEMEFVQWPPRLAHVMLVGRVWDVILGIVLVLQTVMEKVSYFLRKMCIKYLHMILHQAFSTPNRTHVKLSLMLQSYFSLFLF